MSTPRTNYGSHSASSSVDRPEIGMSTKGDIDDIVHSFVTDDLASLDQIGENDGAGIELSPKVMSLPATLSKSPSLNSVGRRNGAQESSKGSVRSPSGSLGHSGSFSGLDSSNPRQGSTEVGTSSPFHTGSLPGQLPKTRSVSSSTKSTASAEKRSSSISEKFKSFGKRLASGSSGVSK